MSDTSGSAGDGAGDGKHGQARRLAEAAMTARRDNRHDEAERLLADAQRIDPEAVADVLARNPAFARLDAAGMPGDAEVAAIGRTIQPGSDAPSRAGITGSGSGADT